MSLKTLLTPHRRSMLPFYFIVVAVIAFAGLQRVHTWYSDSVSDSSQADCNAVCGKFEQCLAEIYTSETLKPFKFTIVAGCQNGCAKQKKHLASCFQGSSTCQEATMCIMGKLK
ncbi:MAG: Cys-rich protein [Leptospirales bacterium]|nr:Cys-rich protein [Leptospirales bacterium]